jgi:Lrp/AsnC family leucine-responsive transcriptional regulator
LDETDWAILELLQEDARLSFSEIGRRVHLSQPAVAERVRLMEESSVITGYHAAVDTSRLDLPIMAFIRTATGTKGDTEQILAYARDLPEVIEFHRVTGVDGVVLKVVAPSIARLNVIIHEPGEMCVPTTSIVLVSDLKRRTIRRDSAG